MSFARDERRIFRNAFNPTITNLISRSHVTRWTDPRCDASVEVRRGAAAAGPLNRPGHFVLPSRPPLLSSTPTRVCNGAPLRPFKSHEVDRSVRLKGPSLCNRRTPDSRLSLSLSLSFSVAPSRILTSMSPSSMFYERSCDIASSHAREIVNSPRGDSRRDAWLVFFGNDHRNLILARIPSLCSASSSAAAPAPRRIM